MKKTLYGLGILSLFVFVGCTTIATRPTESTKRLSVMTFNVENLFDTSHDKGKDDYTYLPLSGKATREHYKRCQEHRFQKWIDECMDLDWNEKVLAQKMKNLAAAILSVNKGRGPDILVLQEVENIGVLEDLRQKFLSNANYFPAILLEGTDKRGIDVAMLSRLPLQGKPQLHYIKFKGISAKDKKDTRPILQARFSLPDGKPLTVYGVHFPAPFHKHIFREQAFQKLNEIARKTEGYQIAAGDFNVPAEEDSKVGMLKRFVEGNWIVAHKLRCRFCRGTNYYEKKDSWSFLDMILLSENFRYGDGWKVDLDSIMVANKGGGHITEKGTPYRYDPKTGKGVSDHWPIYLEFVRN